VGGVAGDIAVIVDGMHTMQKVVWQNGETRVLNSLNNSYRLDSINSINDQGIVVGSSYAGDLGTKLHAVMWNETGVIDLGGLNGLETAYSEAADINAAGAIAGYSTFSSSNVGIRAVIWQEGKIIDLSEGYGSAALSINNHGVVAGFAQTEHYKFHATVWADNKMIVLQDTPGSYSSVKSINNKNQMVGSEFGGAQGAHALLWNSFHSAPIDLNQFLDQFLIEEGWVLTEAKDINDHGYIVGTAKNSKTNQEHAFLLTPEDLKGLSNLMPTTPAAEVGDYNQHHGLQTSQIVVTGNPTNNNPSPDAWAFGF